MEFNKKVEVFQKLLYMGYERCDKLNESDWYDEAVELALLIKKKDTVENVSARITEYLTNKFNTDTYTPFDLLGSAISKKIFNHL